VLVLVLQSASERKIEICVRDSVGERARKQEGKKQVVGRVRMGRAVVGAAGTDAMHTFATDCHIILLWHTGHG
jgi:hypothetical protein